MVLIPSARLRLRSSSPSTRSSTSSLPPAKNSIVCGCETKKTPRHRALKFWRGSPASSSRNLRLISDVRASVGAPPKASCGKTERINPVGGDSLSMIGGSADTSAAIAAQNGDADGRARRHDASSISFAARRTSAVAMPARQSGTRPRQRAGGCRIRLQGLQ